MTSREQFEAEMAKLNDVLDMRRAKNGDIEYMAWDVALAWKMWQASRDPVEVELPEEMKAREALDKGFMCDYAAGVTDTVVQMRENLRAAGIKVKGE